MTQPTLQLTDAFYAKLATLVWKDADDNVKQVLSAAIVTALCSGKMLESLSGKLIGAIAKSLAGEIEEALKADGRGREIVTSTVEGVVSSFVLSKADLLGIERIVQIVCGTVIEELGEDDAFHTQIKTAVESRLAVCSPGDHGKRLDDVIDEAIDKKCVFYIDRRIRELVINGKFNINERVRVAVSEGMRDRAKDVLDSLTYGGHELSVVLKQRARKFLDDTLGADAAENP